MPNPSAFDHCQACQTTAHCRRIANSLSVVMILTSFIATYALIAITPGPNIAVVVQASLRHGRRRALMAAAGVAIGAAMLTTGVIATAIHVPRTPVDARGVSVLYGLFVIWMGVGCFRKSSGAGSDLQRRGTGFCQALLVALVNPYTALLIITYISAAEPAQISAAAPGIVLSVFLVAGCWFSCVALGFSSRLFAKAHLRLGAGIEPVIGVLLIGLGVFSVLRTLPL